MHYKFEALRSGRSGFHIRGYSGELLGDRKLVYLDDSGQWRLADAETASREVLIGMTIGPVFTGQSGDILLRGFIGHPDWYLEPWKTVYASDMAGEITQEPPLGYTNEVLKLGKAFGRDLMFFNPVLRTR